MKTTLVIRLLVRFLVLITLGFQLGNVLAVSPIYQQIEFLGTPSTGVAPSTLVQAMDGSLYGVANYGGTGPCLDVGGRRLGCGTVFKLNPDGTGFRVILNLDANGSNPSGPLLQGADGMLYGISYSGGSNGSGSVFKLNPDGTGFTVLHSFDSSATGGAPRGGLVQATDGTLYGTTATGGTSDGGTVYRLNTDGTGFAVLHHFGNSTTGGQAPSGLILSEDGTLYGTASRGGAAEWGILFKLNVDGTGFTVMHNFDYSTTGGAPSSRLAQGADGSLYGTASVGGISGSGTLFKLNSDGTGLVILKHFDGSTTGGDSTVGSSLGRTALFMAQRRVVGARVEERFFG